MTKPSTGLMEWLQQHAAVLPEETVKDVELVGVDPNSGRTVRRKSDITLRGLSSRERDEFEVENMRRTNVKAGNGATPAQGNTETDLTNFRARWVARHIVEGGMRIFANPHGEELLGNQSAAVLMRLFTVVERLSGLSPKDVEKLTKNSAATGTDEPSSDLPESSDAPSKSSDAASATAN